MKLQMRGMLMGLVTALSCVAMVPTGAQAELELEPGSFKIAASSLQAGSHADLTTSFAFVQDEKQRVGGTPRNVEVELPVGLTGYITGIPTCTPYQLQHALGFAASCPVGSQIGSVELTLNPFGTPIPFTLPVYNMARSASQTAVFGFIFSGVITSNVVISVRPGDYGLRATLSNVLGTVEVDSARLTVWGVPASSEHDGERGEICINGGCFGGGQAAGINPLPLLREPTECAGVPLVARLTVESWASPDTRHEAETTFGPITGCEHLQFAPDFTLRPTVAQAGEPSGYTFGLKMLQNPNSESIATADLKKAIVALPEGVILSPAAANGLQACTDAQVGLGTSEPVACPEASKIGEARLTTPSLPDELAGGVYLAAPPSGVITGSPYRIFLTLSGDGVSVKLVGEVEANNKTGRLTATFAEDPQLPFSELRLSVKGGARAPLVNPQGCGTFDATTQLEPWSWPSTPDAEPFGEFTIVGCQDVLFKPAFTAGTINNQAAGFSPFTLTLSRNDGEQTLSTVATRMPPGLAGLLAKVPLCHEAQANAGDCPAASKIGHVTVTAGAGSEPIALPQAGKPQDPVYLTGPYKGAPFGLSIVVPAEAGPFNLDEGGRPVVVRAKIEVDPHTAQVSVASDPMPTILQGVPVDVRTVNVTIDRPGFIFNPTDCNALKVTGAIGSTQGAKAAVANRFQAANCAALPFKPGFKVTTRAKHTRRGGAYLRVNVTSGKGQANIKSVRVELPKILASRDETLNQACPEKQFAANAAGCPKGSFVGTAIARTPVLPVPLTGPAIFVSHGGAAFPDLDVVLQGDGVTVDLTGNTNIVKDVTISDFRSVPDVPVSSFQLTLPTGPHSALAANGNLCTRSVKTKAHGHVVLRKRTLAMPTIITGQNGAVIDRKTVIKVEGCRRAAHRAGGRKGAKGKG